MIREIVSRTSANLINQAYRHVDDQNTELQALSY